ncbi:MBL fold metallo-hydrolase [Candidatus Bathyarchaeota archaeon]|nr:MBL fold metallo-hydrolase [Candidatus Bathyarchaeota archaeon]
MKITLLGTGGPRPDPKRMGPSTLVTVGSDNLIFDAGRGVATRLVQAGVSITDYGYVFITHLHFDHTGGLADLLFAAWNKARNKTIHVYGPKGTEAMVRHLFEAYERDIWYRLSETVLTHEKLVDIRNMVQVHDVGAGVVVEGTNFRVTAVDVDHGHGLGLSRDDWACLAYRVESKGSSVVISGDAVYSPSLIDIARDADALVMCCYLSGEEIKDHDTELITRYVLNSSLGAGKIAHEANVKLIALIHIREKPDRLLEAMKTEIGRDFDGNIVVGEDLLEIDLG